MITVIGDLAVDIFVRKGATHYATDTNGQITFRAGGQGNNVAAWIASEGADCRLIGKVGKDFLGTYLLDEAKKHGIVTTVSADATMETGKIAITVDKGSGERSMVSDRGANVNLTESDVTGVGDSEVLYISGYSLFAERPRRAAEFAKQTALSHEIPIAVDPSSVYFLKNNREEFRNFLEGAAFLFPNYEEGVLLTGEREPRQILAGLKQLVPYPVLKLGSEGCLLYQNGAPSRVPGKPVRAVDTTGAGDSFAGSFLATYVRTRDFLRSATRAVEVSAGVVKRVGGRPLL